MLPECQTVWQDHNGLVHACSLPYGHASDHRSFNGVTFPKVPFSQWMAENGQDAFVDEEEEERLRLRAELLAQQQELS